MSDEDLASVPDGSGSADDSEGDKVAYTGTADEGDGAKGVPGGKKKIKKKRRVIDSDDEGSRETTEHDGGGAADDGPGKKKISKRRIIESNDDGSGETSEHDGGGAADDGKGDEFAYTGTACIKHDNLVHIIDRRIDDNDFACLRSSSKLKIHIHLREKSRRGDDFPSTADFIAIATYLHSQKPTDDITPDDPNDDTSTWQPGTVMRALFLNTIDAPQQLMDSVKLAWNVLIIDGVGAPAVFYRKSGKYDFMLNEGGNTVLNREKVLGKAQQDIETQIKEQLKSEPAAEGLPELADWKEHSWHIMVTVPTTPQSKQVAHFDNDSADWFTYWTTFVPLNTAVETTQLTGYTQLLSEAGAPETRVGLTHVVAVSGSKNHYGVSETSISRVFAFHVLAVEPDVADNVGGSTTITPKKRQKKKKRAKRPLTPTIKQGTPTPKLNLAKRPVKQKVKAVTLGSGTFGTVHEVGKGIAEKIMRQMLTNARVTDLNNILATLPHNILPMLPDGTGPTFRNDDNTQTTICTMGMCLSDARKTLDKDTTDEWPLLEVLEKVTTLYTTTNQNGLLYMDYKLLNIGVTDSNELVLLDLDSLHHLREASQIGAYIDQPSTIRGYQGTYTLLNKQYGKPNINSLLRKTNADDREFLLRFLADAQVTFVMAECCKCILQKKKPFDSVLQKLVAFKKFDHGQLVLREEEFGFCHLPEGTVNITYVLLETHFPKLLFDVSVPLVSKHPKNSDGTIRELIFPNREIAIKSVKPLLQNATDYVTFYYKHNKADVHALGVRSYTRRYLQFPIFVDTLQDVIAQFTAGQEMPDNVAAYLKDILERYNRFKSILEANSKLQRCFASFNTQ